MSVPTPVWLVTYEGVDVSDRISPMIVSSEYVDHLKGKSDELSLTLQNADGRWLEGWWPAKGDRLSLKFGYQGEALVDTGRFQIDEPEVSIAGDTITLRALAVPSTSPFRTGQNRGWEGITLAELGARMARELELELVGEIAPVAIERISQRGEPTIAFLARVAEAYGYAFSVRPPQLIFYPIVQLEARDVSVEVDRTGMQPGAHFKAATAETYVACEVSYLDPRTKSLTKVRVDAAFARQRVVVGGASGDALRGVPTIPTRTLRVGVTGDDVRRWQTWLASRGHDPGPIDGIFGPRTRAATIAFQAASGIARDGVAGPETFRVSVEQGFGVQAPAEPGLRIEPAGAVLRREIRAENAVQAEAQARALLEAANRLRGSGSFAVRGNGLLVAGANIGVTGLGRLSGKYAIQSSRHRMSRGGYATEVEVTSV